jgi:uncharacterized protein (DUF427 family)
MRAVWNGVVVAGSRDTVRLEGNHYFPLGAVRREFLQHSATHTSCPWKGTASYYDVVVNGEANIDVAWCYPNPSPAAANIAGHVAFWHGVQVEPSDGEATGGWFERARRLVGR